MDSLWTSLNYAFILKQTCVDSSMKYDIHQWLWDWQKESKHTGEVL